MSIRTCGLSSTVHARLTVECRLKIRKRMYDVTVDAQLRFLTWLCDICTAERRMLIGRKWRRHLTQQCTAICCRLCHFCPFQVPVHHSTDSKEKYHSVSKSSKHQLRRPVTDKASPYCRRSYSLKTVSC